MGFATDAVNHKLRRVQADFLQFTSIIGGSVIVESVFGRPGH